MTDLQLMPPQPRSAGPEMAALARFYVDVTWTGTIEAGGMGPGTPAMTGRGAGRHHVLQDGMWIVGDYRQDQFLPDGTFVLTWQLHWVTGWDADAGEYVATHNDNYGHAGVLHGRIDGDRLIYESSSGTARLRMTFDVSDPQCVVWTNETSPADGPWRLIERYRMTPDLRPRAAGPPAADAGAAPSLPSETPTTRTTRGKP